MNVKLDIAAAMLHSAIALAEGKNITNEDGVTVGLTGPDWEPTPETKYYAQRDDGAAQFGSTAAEAIRKLELAERTMGKSSLFVVKFKQHGALNCEEQLFGPFADYMDAEDALAWLPMLYGQGGREWPKDFVHFEADSGHGSTHDGYRTIVELVDPLPYHVGAEQ